jgi:single-strand DNA-binding protein
MANDTVITVIGNLTADPELRTVGSGAQVADFTIASTPRTYNRQTQQWEDGDALFLRCSAWRDMAQNIASSLTKGTRVIAQGRLVQRSYTAQDGSTRSVVELRVDEIGPSLRYASAQVTRTPRQGGASGYAGGARPAAPAQGGYSGGASAAAPAQSGQAGQWGSYGNYSNGAGFGASGTGQDADPLGSGDEPAF